MRISGLRPSTRRIGRHRHAWAGVLFADGSRLMAMPPPDGRRAFLHSRRVNCCTAEVGLRYAPLGATVTAHYPDGSSIAVPQSNNERATRSVCIATRDTTAVAAACTATAAAAYALSAAAPPVIAARSSSVNGASILVQQAPTRRAAPMVKHVN